MGCCTSQKQGQKEEQKTMQQQQVQQQVPEPPKEEVKKEQTPPQAIQTTQAPIWFKEQQRKDAQNFQDFDVIGGFPKSSKYEGRVQVFEIQKKNYVKAEDIKIQFGTGLKEDHVSKTVGAVKTLEVDNQADAQKIYDRLKDVKDKLRNIQNDKVVDFELQVTKNQTGRFFIDIFMPFAPFGTLEEEIQKRIKGGKRYFDSKEIETFMDQSLRVFQTLQDKNIQHMDIKPHNFLLIDSNSISQAKISDFRAVPDFISAIPNKASEHFEYLAPKLREQTGDQTHCPYKSDLFSLGLTWLRVSTLQDVRGINTKQDVDQ